MNCQFVSLDEFVRLKRGYDLPERERREGDIPILGSFGVTGRHDTAKLAGPGVTIGRSGASIGVATYSNEPYWPLNTALYVQDFKGNDPRFVYFVLDAIDFRPHNSGAAQPSLNRNYLGSIRVWCPDLRTQREVACALGSLDDLIENNRRRIEILEEMARLIYREWFVRFRFPGHEDVGLGDSELGPIPEGWEAGQVGDVLRLQRGFDLPANSRKTTGSVPVLAASGTHGCHDEAKVAGPGIATGRSGTIGSVTYIHDDFWPLNTVLWVKEYRRSSPMHAYFFLESLNLIGLSSGAAVPTLNRNHVHARKAPVPPERLVSEYDALTAPMFELRSTLERQVSILSEARDLLLPRLISGELDVSGLDLDLEPVA